MAKKAKKAKKRARKPKRNIVFTKEMILADWKKTVKKALKTKSLDPAIDAAFEPPLLVSIQARLTAGGNYNVEGANTRKVAKFVGTVCRMMTAGTTVSLGVFEKVFALAKIHPACPGGNSPGSGQYCDI